MVAHSRLHPAAFLPVVALFAWFAAGCASPRVEVPFGWAMDEPRGYRLLQEGDLPAAETAFREAIARSPNRPAGYFGLGKTSFLLGRHGAAIASLETVVDLEPGNAEAWALLGEARLHAEENDAARQALLRALEIEPENGRALLAYSEYLYHVDNDRETALVYLERAKAAANVYVPPELETALRKNIN